MLDNNWYGLCICENDTGPKTKSIKTVIVCRKPLEYDTGIVKQVPKWKIAASKKVTLYDHSDL
jgi:hypothetical protein